MESARRCSRDGTAGQSDDIANSLIMPAERCLWQKAHRQITVEPPKSNPFRRLTTRRFHFSRLSQTSDPNFSDLWKS